MKIELMNDSHQVLLEVNTRYQDLVDYLLDECFKIKKVQIESY
jgi:hypothetical protein